MLGFLGENAGAIVELAVMLVGAFALLATMTPNEADNRLAQFLLSLVNKLGANVGNARNE